MSERKLIIIGASGALGSGAAGSLIQKDFDPVYLPGVDAAIYAAHKNTVILPKVDFSNEQQCVAFFEQLEVNPADKWFLFSSVGGYTGGKKLAEHSVDELHKMVMLNIKVSFLILKHFTGLVAGCSGGSAMFTSAMTGLSPAENNAVYGATKAALNYLVQSAALESQKMNLSVNAIAPNLIQTPENLNWAGEEAYARMQNPAEVGELVYQLFRNFHIMTGNIIELSVRFPDVKF